MITSERVIRVVDGDTFMTAGRERAVRLANVDAPEKGRPGAAMATRFLSTMILGKNVNIDPVAKDTYGRTVAKVTINGRPVEEAMARSLRAIKAAMLAASRISSDVGNGRANLVDDVLWLKRAMHELGRYRLRSECHGYITRGLQEAVEGYQQDRGLKPDGFLKPMGETERCIRVELIRLGKE